MQSEIKNARISDVFLGFQDHGIFTCMITVDYDGSSQAVPALNLSKNASSYLIQLLNTFQVSSFDLIKGQYCRVKLEDGMITHIGHIVNNVWLDANQCLSVKGDV